MILYIYIYKQINKYNIYIYILNIIYVRTKCWGIDSPLVRVTGVVRWGSFWGIFGCFALVWEVQWGSAYAKGVVWEVQWGTASVGLRPESSSGAHRKSNKGKTKSTVPP